MTARTRITDALVDLVASQGIDGVSVRKVASAAGVSLGLVQHHFPTKQAMLRAARERVDELFLARLTAMRADDAPAATQARALAEQLVPLDDARRAEGAVWLAFVAHGVVDPDVAAAHTAVWRELEDAFTALLAAHRGGRAAQRDRDAAAVLLATLDGIAVAGLVEPARMPPARQRRLVALAVDQACP